MIISSRRSLLPRPPEKTMSTAQFRALIFLFLFGSWLVTVLVAHSITLGSSVFFIMLAVWAVMSFRLSRAMDRQMKNLIKERTENSICAFARSLDYRKIDTRIIRAVHEEFQHYLESWTPLFSVRASDRWEKDLLIDSEDFDDMVQVIAMRTGRSLDNYEANPFYGKLETVSDLVLFFTHQPMKT